MEKRTKKDEFGGGPYNVITLKSIGEMLCPECGGKGKVCIKELGALRDCFRCKGTGHTANPNWDGK